jgi:hypothetical protein
MVGMYSRGARGENSRTSLSLIFDNIFAVGAFQKNYTFFLEIIDSSIFYTSSSDIKRARLSLQICFGQIQCQIG